MKKTTAQLAASARWRERNREASRLRAAKWRAENPQKYRAMADDWARRNPEKAAARNAVRQAVYDGKLMRLPCWVCGSEKTEAHHSSYAEDMRLVVTWLCKLHHREIHRRAVARMAAPKVKLTPDLIAKALAIRNTGAQWKEVAAAVGVSAGQVRERLKGHPELRGFSRWGPRAHLAKDALERAMERLK